MHCPLCQSENNQKELFKTVNAFTSSGKLDKNPTQIKTTITTNDGGGYCKGNNTITFTQCQDCGYIYNSTFDLNKISKEYQSKGYFPAK